MLFGRRKTLQQYSQQVQATDRASAASIFLPAGATLVPLAAHSQANACTPHHLLPMVGAVNVYDVAKPNKQINLVYCYGCLEQLVAGAQVCGNKCSVRNHRYVCHLPTPHQGPCQCADCSRRQPAYNPCAVTQLGTYGSTACVARPVGGVDRVALGGDELHIATHSSDCSLAEYSASSFSTKKHSWSRQEVRTGSVVRSQQVIVLAPISAQGSIVRTSPWMEDLGVPLDYFPSCPPALFLRGPWANPCFETKHAAVVVAGAGIVAARENDMTAAIQVPLIVCQYCGKMTCALVGPTPALKKQLPSLLSASEAMTRLTKEVVTDPTCILNASVPALRITAAAPSTVLIETMRTGRAPAPCAECLFNHPVLMAMEISNVTVAKALFHMEHHEEWHKKRNYIIVQTSSSRSQHNVVHEERLLVCRVRTTLTWHRLQCSQCERKAPPSRLETEVQRLLTTECALPEDRIFDQLVCTMTA